jgi:hypothetical protein
MSKRILTFGSLAAVLITALMLNLSILDIVDGTELRETLAKTLSVVGVSTAAIVAIAAILRMGRASTEARTHDK